MATRTVFLSICDALSKDGLNVFEAFAEDLNPPVSLVTLQEAETAINVFRATSKNSVELLESGVISPCDANYYLYPRTIVFHDGFSTDVVLAEDAYTVLDDFRKTVTLAEKNYESLNERFTTVCDELENANEEIEDFRTEVAKLTDEILDLNDTTDLADKVDELIIEVDDLTSDIEDVRDENSDLHREVETLKVKLEKVRDENDDLNVTLTGHANRLNFLTCNMDVKSDELLTIINGFKFRGKFYGSLFAAIDAAIACYKN
jgi:FtsZ-binding cell division protein ZapB